MAGLVPPRQVAIVRHRVGDGYPIGAERSPHMGTEDKARNLGENLKGKAKEATGKVTDDERLEAEGERDQASADLKQRGEQLKDAGEDVKDAFKR
jgi:uncharacterized protein YjbJ (UPF0337 family)